MWFLVRKEEYCCGSTDYESFDKDDPPQLGKFKVEYRSYIEPRTFTQKMLKHYKTKKKTIDGEVYEKTESFFKLDSLPSDHEKWLNHVTKNVGEDIHHEYQVEMYEWFVEINSLEDFLDFQKEYGSEIHRWFRESPLEILVLNIS